MRIFFPSLLLAVALAGCSYFSPPQEVVAGKPGEYFSFQVPGSWESKEDEWYEGRERRLRVHEANVDPRSRKVKELARALEVLQSMGPEAAANFLQSTSRVYLGRVPKDETELNALWEKTQEARALLYKLAKEKPSPDRDTPARAFLESVKQGYEDLEGDFESQARRLADALLGGHYDFASEPVTALTVGEHPAIFVTASSSTKGWHSPHVGVLVFQKEGKLFALSLHSKKPVKASEGEALASTVRVGVEPNADSLPGRKKKQASSSGKKLPEEVWLALVVLGAAVLPAAFGAASGYGSPRGPGFERAAGAGAGAFFFTGVGMMIGVGVLFVLALAGIADAPTPSGGLMVGVAMLVFLAFYGTAAVISCLLTSYLASVGARLGAKHSRFAAALLAGFFAGVGSLLIPLALGWFR